MNIQNIFSEISPTNMAKLGISCLHNAAFFTLFDANNQGQTSLNESEIHRKLGVNEVYSSDRIIFSILDNLANTRIIEDIGHAQWRLRKTEGSSSRVQPF